MGTLKGIYKPENPKKYIGNPNMIVYRSSWERKFCRYCDTKEHIKRWASEEITVPYYNPIKKRLAKYYPDFYIEIQAKDKPLEKILIEVKPFKETQPPKYKRRTKNTLLAEAMYSQNTAKWKAAEEFCLDQGWTFRIMTEKELGV
jgi:hypothetical protein